MGELFKKGPTLRGRVKKLALQIIPKSELLNTVPWDPFLNEKLLFLNLHFKRSSEFDHLLINDENIEQ